MTTTRREFLQRAAAAGAAASLPFTLTAGRARAANVNSQLTVAAIGVGGSRGAFSQGGAVARRAAQHARMIAVCDVDAVHNAEFNKSFEGKLTDCRRCPRKHECMRNPASADTREGHGRQVSFTVSTGRSATDWMRRRVDSALGKHYYSHRMSVVEPVFANIGTNKGLSRFSLRGRHKVQGQWRLYCLVHNIEKLMRYGAIR